MCIIEDVLDTYYNLHATDLKNAETQQQLTRKEFHDFSYGVIDTFGALANYKRHRK